MPPHSQRYMRRLSALLFLVLTCSLTAVAQQIKISVDRPLQAYEVGETVVFRVESQLRGLLTYRIGYSERSGLTTTGTIDYRGGVLEISYPTQIATFLLMKVQLGGQGAELGVVVGRDQIDALTPEPADYDAFWATQKAQLAAVPLDPRIEKIAESALSTSYRFSAAQIEGRRVYGFFVVPKGDGPKPAVLRLPPFGSSPNITAPQTDLAEKGNMVAFSISIHNAPVEQRDPRAYEPDDPRDRETIYYRYAVLAAIRTIDVLATLPEWNKRDLLVYGDSQGGGLAMITAGVDPRVTLLMESVGALSQLNGEKFGQPSGFPYYLRATKDKYGVEGVEQASTAVKYYDAIYAARRFTGPSLHYSNYLDDVVPPATVYAAINAAAGPTTILHSFDLGHTNPPSFFEDLFDFTRLHFEGSRNPPFIYASKRRGYAVDAGLPTTGKVGEPTALVGTAGVDGSTLGAGWSTRWRKVSGPGEVTFATPQALATAARFSEAGTYVLEFQAVDPRPDLPRGYVLLTDEVTVTVAAGTSTTVASLASVDRVEVYPNPVDSYLEVAADFTAADVVSIELYDAVGRLVERRGPFAVGAAGVAGAAGASLRERLETTDLAAGTYLLLLRGRAGAHRQFVTVAR